MYINQFGQLMADCCDIIYGIEWHEYDTLPDSVWFKKCPVWHYERYN